jgi:signal recognition particle receptor subunit beta
MVFFNYATMQMAAKIVYYGPGLCGKTTNLHHIYTKTSPQSRGEMVSLETETDRTLFFDLLPIDVGVIGGFKTRLQLYTVPGQVFYNTTRKLVLKGVDGIVFVADSQLAMLDANVESLKNLRENLAEIGLDLSELPLVLQLNKRDLPNVAPVQTLLTALDPERKLEWVESVASSGTGVFETLKLISKLTLRTLRRRMTGDDPRPATQSQRPGQLRVREDTNPVRAMPESPAPATPSRPVPTVTIPASPTFTRPAVQASAAVAEPFQPASEPEQVVLPETAQPEPAAPPAEPDADETLTVFDRSVLADAPVEEPPPLTIDLESDGPTTEYVPPPAATAPSATQEPEVDFTRAEKPPKNEPDVKTVKVRSSIDVMAELEALRKRATQTTPRPSRRDALADLEALRPRRDVHRTMHVQIPADALPRSRSVRVTLVFEDGGQVIETRDETLDLGDTSDVQTLSVNLKIDLT